MERRAQHADERAYRGSDKAHDSFPAQWVLTNVRRWVQPEKAMRSLEEGYQEISAASIRPRSDSRANARL